MKFYSIDEKKTKNTYNAYIKYSVKNFGIFVRFSYVFEKILLLSGVVLVALNLINVVFISHEPLFLLFLIMTGGFPYGLSLIFKAVYKEWILKEYKYRGNQKLGLDNGKLQYSYTSPMSNIDKVHCIELSNIDRVEYALNKQEITIFASIEQQDVVQDEIIETRNIESISFLNIFKKDVIDLLRKSKVDIKEI